MAVDQAKNGRSPSGRATHERSRVSPSPPTVGVPNAERWPIEPTQFGDDVAQEMRAYFDAHKNDRWRRGTADNLMIGMFNIAARAVGERYNDRLVETQMLAHKWMVAHDKLKAGKPYDLPKPADLPDRVRKLEGDIGRIEGFARTMFTGFLVGIENNKSVTGWSRRASDDAEKLFTAALHDYRVSLAEEEVDAR